MKRTIIVMMAVLVTAAMVCLTPACGGKEEPAAVQKEQVRKQEVDMELQKKAEAILDVYLAEYEKYYTEGTNSYWKAANTGKKEDFDAYAAADLAMNQMHSDPQRYKEIETLMAQKDKLKPLTARSLEVAYLNFKGNQLPKDMLEKMSKQGAEIELAFNNFRGKVDGNEYSDNQLLEMIKKTTDSARRQKIWEALKQVGEAVDEKLIQLAKIRNEAAVKLGYINYWDMQVRLQEHDPEQIISIFAELEKETDEPFKQMKSKMDAELAKRFTVGVGEMMPWHYDNPFFQAAPPSDKVDLDEFYREMKKESIVELGRKFYNDIGLPIDDIIARSDLYEREGKQQHAFCIHMDNKGDTRVLVNIKPTAEWMDTFLHEMGHAVYNKYADFKLPYNLRDAAHIFTTETSAMLFGALAKNPSWILGYTGADENRVKEMDAAILEQRRREQLIFARWSLVMLNFERALYENPERDLKTLWWDMVERYQMLTRPKDRSAADWAAKIHFTIAPVYYHNYMLGELFAAQLRSTLVKIGKHDGPAHTLDYARHKEFGEFLKEKIYQPGMKYPWPEFIKNATGENLTAKYFAAELE